MKNTEHKTNGDMVKSLFSYLTVSEATEKFYSIKNEAKRTATPIIKDWWDGQYKSKKPKIKSIKEKTNGDVLKILFKDLNVSSLSDLFYAVKDGATGIIISKEWWDSPYKKEV